jgi:GWxTD domain-containing protein
MQNTYNLLTEWIRPEGQFMRNSRFLLILAFLSLGFSAISSPADKPKKSNRKDGDRAQYFKQWLNEDVDYIISPEERNVFKELKNDEERENFIEDFWNRRNPDRRASYNSFKEEHYRRIAYANEHFHSGIPGWKTDRGRVYIVFGKPDQLESHPTGGFYARPMNEGGGTTSTKPFEKWWYRHLDGVGDDIEIEFVDTSGGGNEFRIAMDPNEKDAFLNVPNAGLTLAEEQGLAKKEDRSIFNPTAWNDPDNPVAGYMRAKDRPFDRMEQYFNVQRPPEIKFDDLKSIVTTHVTYNTLPYDIRTDYIKLSSDRALVPITMELNNNLLQFKREANFNKANVNVYGTVIGLNNRIETEFEDVIALEYLDENFQEGKTQRSEYQKIVAVRPGAKYRLELVVTDTNSKNVGTKSVGISVPKYDDTSIQASTIILANLISEAPISSNQLEQYVIGDLKIVPNVKSEYVPGENLRAYLQIYNVAIDQTSLKPSLDVSYVVKKDGKVVEELQDNVGKGIQLVSGLRVVLLKEISLTGIGPGTYTLEVEATDNILARKVTVSTIFKISQPAAPAISAAKP